MTPLFKSIPFSDGRSTVIVVQLNATNYKYPHLVFVYVVNKWLFRLLPPVSKCKTWFKIQAMTCTDLVLNQRSNVQTMTCTDLVALSQRPTIQAMTCTDLVALNQRSNVQTMTCTDLPALNQRSNIQAMTCTDLAALNQRSKVQTNTCTDLLLNQRSNIHTYVIRWHASTLVANWVIYGSTL